MHHSSLPSPGLHIVHYSLWCWWVLWTLMRKQLVPVLGEAAVAWSVTASNPLNISPSFGKPRQPSTSSVLTPHHHHHHHHCPEYQSQPPPPTPSQLRLRSRRDPGHGVTSHSESPWEKWGSCSQACLVQGGLLSSHYSAALELEVVLTSVHHCHSSLPSLVLSISTLTTLNSLLILIDFIIYIFCYSAHCKYLKYIVYTAQQAEVSWSGFLSFTSMSDVKPGSLTTSGTLFGLILSLFGSLCSFWNVYVNKQLLLKIDIVK